MAFAAALRLAHGSADCPVALNAVVGPRGDAYAADAVVPAAEASDYHREQLGWLASTDVDMVSALTFTRSTEAVGFVEAARNVVLPVVVSFTVEIDGRLPSGQRPAEAIPHVAAIAEEVPLTPKSTPTESVA